jgi:hypothetical protein
MLSSHCCESAYFLPLEAYRKMHHWIGLFLTNFTIFDDNLLSWTAEAHDYLDIPLFAISQNMIALQVNHGIFFGRRYDFKIPSTHILT